MTVLPAPTGEPMDRREPGCIEQWPECLHGTYNPHCCRFPKSCSCESRYWATRPVPEDGL